nr:MAG TPA: hypothetical protein [Caudoviricetes sp.]
MPLPIAFINLLAFGDSGQIKNKIFTFCFFNQRGTRFKTIPICISSSKIL